MVGNGRITLGRVSIFVTYYIRLFRTGTDTHNGILMSLFLLVTETIVFILISVSIPFKEKLLKKHKFHFSKDPIDINEVDTEWILLSDNHSIQKINCH